MMVFTGSSGENELLEFEFLMERTALDIINGIPEQVEDVRKMTVDANRRYSFEYLSGFGFMWTARIAGFLVPFWLFRLWSIEGKEQDYIVPPTLSFIPNKLRTPWIVNLVFKKGVADFDEDAFNASMLDLHIKDKIKINPEEEGANIEILDDTGLDKYEGKIISFLRSISSNNLITPDDMKLVAKNGAESTAGANKLLSVQNNYNQLTSGTNDQIANEFIVNGRDKLVLPALICLGYAIVMVGLFIFSLVAEWVFLRAAGYSVILLIQIIIAALYPMPLFGYWRDDYLREKLQWDAFRRHLSDFSQLDRYGPEDVDMWGSWLVYGTALGVGDRVAEAMKMLEIDYAPLRMVPTYGYWFRPITTARTYYSSSSSGGRSGSFGGRGGGFGGGGGSGGGGGGVR
jgi:uncharacterized membrane protein